MGLFRIRRAAPWPLRPIRRLPRGASTAAIVDVETTGLDPRTDEVVELAALLFAFDAMQGSIYGVLDTYSGLRQPRRPIPPGATRIHGITDDLVRGQRLDEARITSLLDRADFVIAHNAGFDFGFVSRLIPGAASKRWLCSMEGIDWYGRGHASRSLQALLKDHRIRGARAHRALGDAQAVLLLLSQGSPAGETNLGELLRGLGKRSKPGIPPAPPFWRKGPA